MSLAAGFLGYLVRIVLARQLTKAEYGLFYGVFILYGFLSLFRDMGLGPSLIKHLPEFQIQKRLDLAKGAISITFGGQFAVSLVIFIIFIIFSPQIAEHFFHDPGAVVPLRLLAVMFLLMPFEKIVGFTFQGFQRIDFVSMIEFVRMMFVLVLLFVLFQYHAGIWVPALAYIITYLLQIPFYAPFFKKTFPSFFSVRATVSRALAQQMVLFGAPVMLGIFGSMVLTYTDTLMLAYFTTAETVASYQTAMPTTKLLLYFASALSAVLLPLSSELWARNMKGKLTKGMEMIYRYSFALVFPLSLLMISFPELILKVLFGPEYADAALTLQILAFGTFLYSISFINSNILSGIGRPAENTAIIIIGAVMNVILNLILIPPFGIVGASAATVFSYGFILAGTSWYLKRFVSAGVPWVAWLKTILAGALFVFAIFFIKQQLTLFGDVAEAIITAAASGVLYLILLFLLRIITANEIRYLLGSVFSKKQ